jgi:catecholate siderophore receptor
MKQKTRKTMAGKMIAMFGGMQGWIETATLAAYAVMGGTKSAVAAATGTSEPARSGGTEATQPVKKFDIDSGPLDETVKEFEETTGLTAKVVLPAGTLAGFSSQGVTGLYREDEALRLLYDLDTAIYGLRLSLRGTRLECS